MKRNFAAFIFLIFLNFSLFANSTYKIPNQHTLEYSSENIITNWDFFWDKLVLPENQSEVPNLVVKTPSDWNKYELPPEIKKITKTGKGAGTYRITLTNLKPNQNYAFPAYRLGYTAFEVYAGNKLIFRSGIPNTNWDETIAEQYFDKAVFTSDSEGTATISIFISNSFYRKGGFRGSFNLFEEEAYDEYHTKEVFMYSIFSGILLMIVVYCFLNSILKKSRANVYLALLVLVIYSRIASYLFPLLKAIFPSISFELMLRIEYISVFFIPGFITLFINELSKDIFKHISPKLIAFPSYIFFILNFILPIRLANRMVPFMQAYMFIVIGINSFLFVIKILREKDFICTTAIISFAILAIGGIGDILLINHCTFLNGMHPITPAFVLFSLTQIFLVGSIQNKNYLKTLELNDYLVETNKAYYRFVPKEFLELLSKKDITEVRLGDFKISKAAILSADIRNFTATSEKLAPIQVFELLNTYLKRIAPLIRKYNGIIEKYLGDGIIAIFPESAEAAINCALEMQQEMILLRDEFSSHGMPRIRIGIGIHYGNIVIGTGGTKERMAEISLSKDIDIAVKTESLTKVCLRPILVTAAALNIAQTEAQTAGRELQIIKEQMPQKLSSELKQNVFSIYNENIEPIL